MEKIGLPTLPGQGLRVTASLHSIADERVFAGGDCAAWKDSICPSWASSECARPATSTPTCSPASTANRSPNYTPQKRYLAILNLGDGTGLATWGPFWWHGRSSMWLKDTIDRRFLEGYRQQYGNTPCSAGPE